MVLPVSGVDVVGHPLRAVHYGYMGSPERMQREVNALKRGSGTIAEAPEETGKTFVETNQNSGGIPNWRPVGGGKQVVWWSERDG